MDACDITYTAPFAGAVQRTLASKLAETVSVTDFGAVQDGDPMQTQAAFNAAIAAVKDYTNKRRHVLHVPTGYWNLAGTLQLGSNLSLKGAGKFATIFRTPSVGTAAVSLKECVNTFAGDFCVDNGSPVPGSVGIDMTDAYDCDVSRVIVQNADIGVWLYGTAAKGAYYNNVTSVTVSGQNRVGFLLDSAVDYSNCNRNVLFECQAHHSALPFAVLSGNNNSLYDPCAETETTIDKFFLIDKSWGLVIANPRAEKGGAGASGTGIYLSANARGTTIIEGNFQNVAAEIANLGQGTSRVSSGYAAPSLVSETPAIPGPARYWGVVKTNPASGGSYHTEMQVCDANGPVAVAYAMMYSQNDLTGINWARLIDGDLTQPAFHTDCSDPGAYFRLDFGSPVELRKWRFYVSGAVPCIWSVVKSTDGTTWQTVATNFDVSGGAGWKEIAW